MSKASRPNRDASRRVLDEATRMRRARKALESLESDNFHDDPHAGLTMSKKALSLFKEGEGSNEDGNKRRGNKARKARNSEYYKQRFRKNFAQLLEEDAVTHPEPPNYLSAQTSEPETRPPRRFCAVCGFMGSYACTTCGARFCSLRCQETHLETRCLKWTV